MQLKLRAAGPNNDSECAILCMASADRPRCYVLVLVLVHGNRGLPAAARTCMHMWQIGNVRSLVSCTSRRYEYRGVGSRGVRKEFQGNRESGNSLEFLGNSQWPPPDWEDHT